MAAREYKQLSCRYGGSDCDFLVRAESEDEVLAVVAAHGARFHGWKEVSPDLKSKIKSLIKTVVV